MRINSYGKDIRVHWRVLLSWWTGKSGSHTHTISKLWSIHYRLLELKLSTWLRQVLGTLLIDLTVHELVCSSLLEVLELCLVSLARLRQVLWLLVCRSVLGKLLLGQHWTEGELITGHLVIWSAVLTIV